MGVGMRVAVDGSRYEGAVHGSRYEGGSAWQCMGVGMRVVVDGISPRYLMAELAMMYSSRLEVPPKLFTTSATFIPGK